MKEFYQKAFLDGTLRELLMHTQEYNRFAYDFNLTDEQLLKLVIASIA